MATEIQILRRIVNEKVLLPYQYSSPLKYFPSSLVADIDKDTWVQKLLKAMNPAKTSINKFNPGNAAFTFETTSFPFYRTSNKVVLSREEAAFMTKNGFLLPGLQEIGSVVNRKVGLNLWRGAQTGDEIPLATYYNFLSDTGTSNGTATRPLPITTATAGVWNTAPNCFTDLETLVGSMQAKGYPISECICFYPMVASAIMNKHNIIATGTYNTRSVREMLLGMGVPAVEPLPDEQMYTAAGATPTAALFDLYLVHRPSIVIGYNYPEETRVIFDDVTQEYNIHMEVGWSVFKYPKYWSDSKYYGGVGRITAIAQS